MHIPQLKNKNSWQRLIVGFFSGAVVSYGVIMFMYGSMYEKLFEENLMLQAEINELEGLYESLLETQKEEKEKNKEKIAVETIEITIMNAEDLEIDRLTVHQLTDMIKREINNIIGQEITSLSSSDHLLVSTIENKRFSIDDFNYAFEVKQMTISTIVKLKLEAKRSK